LVQDFVQSNYILAGVALLFLAVILHLMQIGKAKRVDKKHVALESQLQGNVSANSDRINQLEVIMNEDRNILDFCRDAIASASHGTLEQSAVEPPRDYPEVQLFPDNLPEGKKIDD